MEGNTNRINPRAELLQMYVAYFLPNNYVKGFAQNVEKSCKGILNHRTTPYTSLTKFSFSLRAKRVSIIQGRLKPVLTFFDAFHPTPFTNGGSTLGCRGSGGFSRSKVFGSRACCYRERQAGAWTTPESIQKYNITVVFDNPSIALCFEQGE